MTVALLLGLDAIVVVFVFVLAWRIGRAEAAARARDAGRVHDPIE
jgi:hypothetical protein